MKNDLEKLTDIIGKMNKGIKDKSEMISTQFIDQVFMAIKAGAEAVIKNERMKALKYFRKHMEQAVKLQLIVEMTIKHLNKMVPLSALDFYRLMRCRKIEKDLKELIGFYKDQQFLVLSDAS